MAKPQPTLLDVSIWTRMNKNSDGVVTQQEAREYGFSTWEITEPISQSDFEAKVKAYNDKILAEQKQTENTDKGFSPCLAKKNVKVAYTLSDLVPQKERCHDNAYDARGKDISKLNLTREQLLNLRTDDTTVMSDEQKKLIAKAKEDMKDPGLGIKELHKRGITGKGVKIAIIDQTFTEHAEYSDQVASIESVNGASIKSGSKHAPAVASIAVGKSTGVAPDAQLYCYTSEAEMPDAKTGKLQTLYYNIRKFFKGKPTRTFKNDADAIRRILEKNKELKANGEEPISVISISAPTHEEDAIGEDELQQAIKEAKESGVFVATVNLDTYSDTYLFGTDRKVDGDVNDPSSYSPSNMTKKDFEIKPPPVKCVPQILLVPQEHRTIAAGYDKNSYEYDGNQGGYSWTVPYLAGTYALAKQANPNITPEQFLELAKETGTECSEDGKQYGRLINPQELIKKAQENQ